MPDSFESQKETPINKVEVYVWDWSEEDSLQLVCAWVLTNREYKDILESFSPAQLIYNSWSNEWNLCEYFGLSDDNEDEDSLDEEHNGPDLGDNETVHAAYIAERLQDLAPLPSHDSPIDDTNIPVINIPFDLLDSVHSLWVCTSFFTLKKNLYR